jgi:hypothetical protein
VTKHLPPAGCSTGQAVGACHATTVQPDEQAALQYVAGALQVEEYGEHYQRLAWGLALDIMSADANDTARRDKVHSDAGRR